MKKGFTLIELLIVIVIIGILAAAVITAINPVEQIKKAKDSNKMTAVNELVKAITVYYTAHASDANTYPWTSTTPPAPGGTAITQGALDTIVATLVADPNMKSTLGDRDFSGVQLWFSNDLPMVCFDPDSSTYNDKAAYNATGGTTGTLTYICVK